MAKVGGSDCKESACNAGDPGLNPGSGRSPGEGKGNSLQYSCLENFMDRGYSPWGHKESDTTERLTLSLQQEVFTKFRLKNTAASVSSWSLHLLFTHFMEPAFMLWATLWRNPLTRKRGRCLANKQWVMEDYQQPSEWAWKWILSLHWEPCDDCTSSEVNMHLEVSLVRETLSQGYLSLHFWPTEIVR